MFINGEQKVFNRHPPVTPEYNVSAGSGGMDLTNNSGKRLPPPPLPAIENTASKAQPAETSY